MTAVSHWILLIVLWQGNIDPTVSTYAVKDQATCVRMAQDWAEGEEIMNAEMPPTLGDLYYTGCTLAHGGGVDAA